MSAANHCTQFKEALTDLVDLGEGGPPGLESGVRARLEAHASACGACAEELRTYRRTVELLREMPRYQAPPGFLAWVKAATAAGDAAAAVGAPRDGRRRSRHLLVAASLAGGASVALALYFAGSGLDPGEPRREDRALVREPAPAAATELEAPSTVLLTLVIPRTAWGSLPPDLEGELDRLVDPSPVPPAGAPGARPAAEALSARAMAPKAEVAAADEQAREADEVEELAAREVEIELPAANLALAREALSDWARRRGGRLEAPPALEREGRGAATGSVQVRVRLVPGP